MYWVAKTVSFVFVHIPDFLNDCIKKYVCPSTHFNHAIDNFLKLEYKHSKVVSTVNPRVEWESLLKKKHGKLW